MRFEEEMFKSDADREQAEQSHRGALETIATMTAQVRALLEWPGVCVCVCTYVSVSMYKYVCVRLEW